jgi:phage-related holin
MIPTFVFTTLYTHDLSSKSGNIGIIRITHTLTASDIAHRHDWRSEKVGCLTFTCTPTFVEAIKCQQH